jgi:hypothetical protein
MSLPGGITDSRMLRGGREGEGTPRRRSISLVNYSTNHCCWYMARESAAILCRQPHFLEKVGESRVVAPIFEQRIGLNPGQSAISLFVGTL